MIVKDLRPFSTVKNAGFQGLMKHIVPQYNIPSRYFVDNEFGELCLNHQGGGGPMGLPPPPP